jgi:hypothetical protein
MRIAAMIPLAALLAAAPAAAAPAPQAGSWLPWHGCWRMVTDDGTPGDVLCVVPGSGAAEVRLVVVRDGEVAGSTLMQADGAARTVEAGGCSGTETARWSADGRRVLLRTELDCGGVRRTSTGALAMINDNEWVDVQVSTVGQQHGTRVLRYRAEPDASAPAEVAALLGDARPLVREAARMNAAAPLQVEDVLDAATFLEPPAIQALLVAYGSGFQLDARQLARLQDAGLTDDVIDVMVALSYPQRFAVRDQYAERIHTTYRQRAYSWEDECYDPVYRRYYYGSDCYYMRRWGYGSSRYGYIYSPWGYDPYGWRYGSGPVVVIVRPDDGQPQPPPAGVVRGGGYTRGGPAHGTAQPRSGSTGSAGTAQPGSASGAQPAATSGRSGPSGRTAQPRSGSTTAQPRSTGFPTSSPASSSGTPASGSSAGGSSAGSSGSASSAGSSSSDAPRTAVPRTGGGGGR